MSIFNPKKEVDFAGHALVGTAFFISQILKKPVSFLECRAGRIITWQGNDLTWIRANLTITPLWHHEQLSDVSAVQNLSVSQIASKKHIMVWAWFDQNKSIVRARTFAPDWGIPEDEANGSGSMQLAVMLGRNLVIHHGRGSVIYAKPAEIGFADVGGRIEQDAAREVMV